MEIITDIYRVRPGNSPRGFHVIAYHQAGLRLTIIEPVKLLRQCTNAISRINRLTMFQVENPRFLGGLDYWAPMEQASTTEACWEPMELGNTTEACWEPMEPGSITAVR